MPGILLWHSTACHLVKVRGNLKVVKLSKVNQEMDNTLSLKQRMPALCTRNVAGIPMCVVMVTIGDELCATLTRTTDTRAYCLSYCLSSPLSPHVVPPLASVV